MISFCSREFRAIKLIVFAVAGLKTNYPSFSLPDPEPSVEQPIVLEKEEADMAIRRWKQLKLVVCVNQTHHVQSQAIIRITGEESVHDITSAEDVEKEISFVYPAMVS